MKPPVIGLAASASLRHSADAPLHRWLRRFGPFLAQELGAEFVVLGSTFEDLRAEFPPAASITRLPPARAGGIVHMAAHVVPTAGLAHAIDWVVYLLDPADPVSLFPEMQALKRQCVVHSKPFLSTEAAASEWCAIAWHAHHAASGKGPGVPEDLIARWIRPDQLGAEAIALIAHDRQKPAMLDFARRHRNLLSRFGRRLATGTTGALLNGDIPERFAAAAASWRTLLPNQPENQAGAQAGAQAGDRAGPWTIAHLSGPRGGDAQIALDIVHGACRRVIFFEDPLVAREHEADIQLLERATRFANPGSLCLETLEVADVWASGLEALLARRA